MKKFPFSFFLIYLIISLNVYSQVSVTFDSLADMTLNRYGMGYTYDGTNLYAFTGGTNIPPYNSSSMEIYDLSNNTWTEIRSDLIPRRFGSAEYVSSQDKIYIFNGWYYGSNPSLTYTDTIEIYDATLGALSYSTSNPFPVRYAGSAVWNDKIYVFGGANDSGSSNRLYEFDPAIDQWTRLPDMPEAKSTGGKIVDGVLYVFGGRADTTSTRIDAYDIQLGSWTFLGHMPFGVSSNATVVSGKYIWLVGSYDNLQLLATFDTDTHLFSSLSSNMTGRRHAAAVVVDTNLYIYGGTQTSSSTSALQSLEFANITNYVSSITDKLIEPPNEIKLFQNYPNPFNPTTTIKFSIPVSDIVKLEIFNLAGQKIETLINKQMSACSHEIEFNTNNLPSGIYLYRVKAGGFQETKKMISMK